MRRPRPFDVLALLLLAAAGWALWGWAVREAVWAGDAAACRAAGGACWAFIGEKWRLMLFGLYPPAEQWRAALAVLLSVAFVAACVRWRRAWPLGWLGLLALDYALLAGGFLGLSAVPVAQWGGLPLTLLLTVSGVGGGLPLALLLALGRRSRLPLLRLLAGGYIELIRGVPLVSVLFMAAVMFPLLLPPGWVLGKLLSTQLALALFVAAYLAEAIRGGLQAIAYGQYEAAAALGMRHGTALATVILPQALRIALPALTGIAIGTFKDTSLVVIIGLFDLMTATRAALGDPRWLGFSLEAYLFAALVYGVLSWSLSLAGRQLEKR
ncbi:amino acid ABC transporter permease [Plasticicumulans acidivorans]|uniref:Amino acid ABC transporter membrane protein 2 (PAAT family) n=1 Tax=Plasticicumulans acidivorans TaxID=886464 RepID=A0A317N159_9GAMM|nr:amino acid ABC transporter permease [Plasticicumulans acidivorans]PWV65880.1 amino acid ABC transporter membrane protein 2 (PAAT family) [Plasticicumulans acidivorans]